MMLNQMPAGRPEPQWTKYKPGTDFEDCEYRVDKIEILGVKQKYIMIRGTFTTSTASVSIDMPAGINVFYPMINNGFAIECNENYGTLAFRTTGVAVSNDSPNTIVFNNLMRQMFRFLIFARVR